MIIYDNNGILVKKIIMGFHQEGGFKIVLVAVSGNKRMGIQFWKGHDEQYFLNILIDAITHLN